jgi:uncharacterized protein YpmB
MKATVMKFYNGVKTSTATRKVNNSEELGKFLKSMEVEREQEDVEFDFEVYNEKVYRIDFETGEGRHDLQ